MTSMGTRLRALEAAAGQPEPHVCAACRSAGVQGGICGHFATFFSLLPHFDEEEPGWQEKREAARRFLAGTTAAQEAAHV
jgi:hypothetical protein